jgi:hypothetical protein
VGRGGGVMLTGDSEGLLEGWSALGSGMSGFDWLGMAGGAAALCCAAAGRFENSSMPSSANKALISARFELRPSFNSSPQWMKGALDTQDL